MLDSNKTDFPNPSAFILLGIPGLKEAHVWISILFCGIYAIVILGNFTILFIVKIELSLYAPMYYFLCMPAVIDLALSTSILPKMLSIFWFNSREINFSACLTQMYFIHYFSAMGSGILVAMAMDRYIAICDPLKYSTTLSSPVVAKMGLVMVLRSCILVLPNVFLVRRCPYYITDIIPHTYCEPISMVKLLCGDISVNIYYGFSLTFLITGMACSDITVNSIYGLFITLLTVSLDSLLILLSYVMIFKTVLSVASHAECLRALNTCVSHLFAVLIFYTPEIGLSMIHRFGESSSHLPPILLGYVSMLVPPLMNPIIYSVKSKHLRVRIIRVFVK
uniref:Olfactory receptor n=1 Tax=Gopherus evgoodei TaxID=1825980 RepID=A0A8C4WFF3_9SAUR